jgi:hypothetical protein
MTEILTSIHGNEIGLDAVGRLLVRSGVEGLGVNATRYGMRGNRDPLSAAENSAAFMRAYEAAKADKGLIVIPNGWYYMAPMDLTGADQGVTIIGESWNDNIGESPEVGGAVLELASNSNDSLFTVAADCAPIHFKNLFLRGNQAGQTTGTSHAVEFSDAGSPSRSGTFERVRMERWRSGAVAIGTYRDAGKMDLCVILTCGYQSNGTPVVTRGDGILAGSCNDWRFTRVDCGANGRHGFYSTGAGTVLMGQCNWFSNLGSGIKLDALTGQFDYSCGSIDRNELEGVVLVGSASSTRMYGRTFSQMLFSGNCNAANDTYADIRIADDALGTTALIAPTFSRGQFTNYPKYNIQTTGTTTGVHVLASRYRTDAAASYVTAYTNDVSKLIVYS